MQPKLVRHSKEENIILFLENNKFILPPIKISFCETIFDVKKFCEVQKEIITLALSQTEYDLAVERIVLFRSAVQPK